MTVYHTTQEYIKHNAVENLRMAAIELRNKSALIIFGMNCNQGIRDTLKEIELVADKIEIIADSLIWSQENGNQTVHPNEHEQFEPSAIPQETAEVMGQVIAEFEPAADPLLNVLNLINNTEAMQHLKNGSDRFREMFTEIRDKFNMILEKIKETEGFERKILNYNATIDHRMNVLSEKINRVLQSDQEISLDQKIENVAGAKDLEPPA